MDARLDGPRSDGRLGPAARAGRRLPELDEVAEAPTGTQFEVVLVAVLAGAAVLVFGIIPQPLFELVGRAGGALGGLF